MQSKYFQPAELHTRNGVVPVRLAVANKFLQRFCGLMFRASLANSPLEGMLITRCSSVHTAWMRFPIDLVYLDAEGDVTRCIAALKPWRASQGYRHCSIANRRTAHVLELPAGSIERLGLDRHTRLRHPILRRETQL